MLSHRLSGAGCMIRNLVFPALFLTLPFGLLAQEPKLVLPIGHTFFVMSAKYSPDGKFIITGGADNTIKLWNAESGLLITDIKVHKEPVTAASFSPDGKTILTASDDSTANLLDARTGKIRSVLIDHNKGDIENARFSRDGTKILTNSGDSTTTLWDARTGKALATMRGPRTPKDAEFSPDQKQIVSWYDGGDQAKVWNALSGKLLFDLMGHSDRIEQAHFSPDGKNIVTCSWDKTVRVWDASTGNELQKLTQFKSFVNSVAYTPDNLSLIACSLDTTVRIYSNDYKERIRISLKQFKSEINELAVSKDNRTLVVYGENGAATLWDIDTGKLLAELKGHTADINSVSFSPDGQSLVSASNDATAKIWDTRSGRLIKDLTGHSTFFSAAAYSPDGKMIATNSMDHSRTWDAETGVPLLNLKNGEGSNKLLEYAPDGKRLLIGSVNTAQLWDALTGKPGPGFDNYSAGWDGGHFSHDGKLVILPGADMSVGIFNADSGRLFRRLKGHPKEVTSVQFSPDDKQAVSTSTDRTAKIWDINTGSQIAELDGHTFDVVDASFSPDGKRILTAGHDNTARIWDAATGKMIYNLKEHHSFLTNIAYSDDGSKVVTAAQDGRAIIYDAGSGKLLFDLNAGSDIMDARFFPGGKKIAVTPMDEATKIYDTGNGQLIHDLKGHTNLMLAGLPDPSGNRVLTLSMDNTCKVWDALSGKLIYTFFTVDSTDYFDQIPSGYYKCTQNAARLLHYITPDLQVITFEQLDIKYNRPDKVLEAIHCPDTALVKAYRHAYEKRIEMLKIDTTAFANDYTVPITEIVNRNSLEPQGDLLKIHINGNGKNRSLDRLNIWINQVPVYGANGIDLKKRKSDHIDTMLTVRLSKGSNMIESSVINSNGIESFRKPVQVLNRQTADSGKVYFIGIGIHKFAEPGHDLNWSVADIKSLAERFKEKFRSNCLIDTLFDTRVNIENISGLKQFLAGTSVNDKVVIAYSGHGLLSSDYDYFLSGYRVNFDKPEKGGIPYQTLQGLLDGIPARKKLMLIDACNAGALDKDAALKSSQAGDAADIGQLIAAAKRLSADHGASGGVSGQHFFELMQALFVDVGRSTGSTIISAAAGTQYALEGDGNGYFTRSVLQFLKQPHCSISGLKKFVYTDVAARSKGRQIPTTRSETESSDWSLW